MSKVITKASRTSSAATERLKEGKKALKVADGHLSAVLLHVENRFQSAHFLNKVNWISLDIKGAVRAL